MGSGSNEEVFKHICKALAGPGSSQSRRLAGRPARKGTHNPLGCSRGLRRKNGRPKEGEMQLWMD